MQPRKLCRGSRRCLNELRSHLHGKDHCWIRQIKVAENMGIDVRTVKRYYAALAAAGEIKIQRRGDGQSALVTVTSAVTSETLQRPLQLAGGALVVGENVTSETPYRRPEVDLKKTKYQSECTGQESQEPAVALTEPSSYEKAEADAIANAVHACGFEPTPDLIAKLERKRRYYGVTGFVVASAIARAFKRVEGTSDHPQKPAWLTAVVESALKSEHSGAPSLPRCEIGLGRHTRFPLMAHSLVNWLQRRLGRFGYQLTDANTRWISTMLSKNLVGASVLTHR